jgi:hypothetical protein
MDLFGLIPNEVLLLVFSFVSFGGLEHLYRVNKRCNNILSTAEYIWKEACLEFFRENRVGAKDVEWAQKECRKDWRWFSRYVLSGKVCRESQGGYTIFGMKDNEIFDIYVSIYYQRRRLSFGNFRSKENMCDIKEDITVFWNNKKYVGQCTYSPYPVPHGYGTLYYDSGLEYQGNWYEGRMYKRGRITYPDGNSYEGEWYNGSPEFEAEHTVLRSSPVILLKRKRDVRCTNNIGQLPQKMFSRGKHPLLVRSN